MKNSFILLKTSCGYLLHSLPQYGFIQIKVAIYKSVNFNFTSNVLHFIQIIKRVSLGFHQKINLEQVEVNIFFQSTITMVDRFIRKRIYIATKLKECNLWIVLVLTTCSTFFFFFCNINLYCILSVAWKKVVIQRNTFCKGIHINWFQNICLNWRNSDLEFFVFKIQFHTSQSARSTQNFSRSYNKIVNFQADTSFLDQMKE